MREAAFSDVNILVIDEKPEKMASLCAALASQYPKIDRICSFSPLLDALNRNTYAAIFVDMATIPELDALAFSQLVAQTDAALATTIVFLADTMSAIKAIMALKPTGSVDYLLSPLEPILVRAKAEVCVDSFKKSLQIQNQARELARESENRFRIMADHAPVLLWMAGTDARCNFFNQPWLEFTGRTQLQECGYGWAEGIHPEDFQECVDTYMESFVTRKKFTMEYRLRRHDGQYRWMLDNGVPRYLKSGEFAGYIGSCIDITERKESEADREKLLRSERSARSEAERLYQAAQEANSLKDEFLATVSHELRTPLNAIVGWAEILQQNALPPEEFPEAIAAIERNAREQSRLINDLLDVSRIITGKIKLDIQPVDVTQIIEDSIDVVKLSAQVRNLEILFESDVAGMTVAGDATRLKQIVWNLLSNAIKFSEIGGLISINLKRKNSQLELRVTDTGEGISPDFIPFVFDRFRQADGSLSRKHSGLGLGLAIVQHLVELHGGSVAAESRGKGTGATFIINFPVMAVRLQKTTSERNIELPELPKQRTPRLNGLNLLLVDDQPDVLGLLEVILSREGAKLTTANSVAEALVAVNKTSFDLIVSDIGMPEQTGHDLVRKLRNDPNLRTCKTPAIALTAHVREEDQQAALAAGFQMHLAKPVDSGLLVNSIARLARRGRAQEVSGDRSQPC